MRDLPQAKKGNSYRADADLRIAWAPVFGSMAKPSPDGRYFSYVNTYGLCLVVHELATKKKRRLTKGVMFTPAEAAFMPVWSPDSSQIAYACINLKDPKFEKINLEEVFCDLRIIGLEGSKPRVLYRHDKKLNEKKLPGIIIPLDWSPDGKSILAGIYDEFEIGKDMTAQAVLVSVEDGSVRVLKSFDQPPKSMPRGAFFSPDGRYVVYDFPQKKDSSEHDIFLRSIEDGREIPLVEHPADDFVIGWAPDRKSLAFASDRAGTWDIWLIQVLDGRLQGDPELVKKDIGPIEPIGLTKKGSFYYNLQTKMRDVFMATLDLKNNRLLSPPKKAIQRFVGSNAIPSWSPDGKYLSYISIRIPESDSFDSRALCIRSTESGKARELFPQITKYGPLRWSSDNRFILTVANEKEICKIDTQTCEVTSILKFESGEFARWATWSHDGKKIFYTFTTPSLEASLKQGQKWRILIYDLDAKQEREIYSKTSAPHHLTLSPDGRFLAFITKDRKGLWRILNIMPVEGGESRELLRSEKGGNITTVAWMPDGQGLLFVKGKNKDQKCELWQISVEGGEPQSIAGLGLDGVYSLSIHPDGRRIAFYTYKESKSIWVMENFLPEVKTKKKSKPRRKDLLPSVGFGKIVGEWEMEVGVFFLSFTIEESKGKLLTGSISESLGDFSNVPLSNIEYDGENLNFEFTVPTPPDGVKRTVKAKLKVGEGRLEGLIIVKDLAESLPAVATRKKK